MLDEKLHALIRKYGVYDVIGGVAESVKSKGIVGKICKLFYLCVGGIRLVWALNKSLDKVDANAAIALWFVDVGRSYIGLGTWIYMVSPKNRKKIRFVIQQGKEVSQKKYYGRLVLSPVEIGKYPIDGIVLTLGSAERHVSLLGNFSGSIIDMNNLIIEKKLGGYFVDIINPHHYCDIFISRYYQERAESKEGKQVWHKRLIAQYLCVRDFVRTKEEIANYEKAGYDDAVIYRDFWHEVEILLGNIIKRVENRNKRDVFIYWIDSLEKDDFFSMKWVGKKNNGMIFHRAYTTMTHTTMVMRSIFTGKNVKAGRLDKLKTLNLSDTVFSEYPSNNQEIHVFSGMFSGKLDESIIHSSCLKYGKDVPFMLLMWNAIDVLLTTSNPCVNLIHCMETHSNFLCGEHSRWPFALCDNLDMPIGYSVDCTEFQKKATDYLDRQIEWYHQFVPQNAVSIYMSDHGNCETLSEEFINVPLKIIGRDIPTKNEYRLFSYKNMHKLIDFCLHSYKEQMNNFFSDLVMVDVIDRYSQSAGQSVRKRAYIHNNLVFEHFDVNFLKRYIQATKIVTVEGEYYTINILGEETYYRDKECKINLADDPAYLKRVAQLREKAGKFYNPWKEKREVAIDFYKYLGIKEEDIINQCY